MILYPLTHSRQAGAPASVSPVSGCASSTVLVSFVMSFTASHRSESPSAVSITSRQQVHATVSMSVSRLRLEDDPDDPDDWTVDVRSDCSFTSSVRPVARFSSTLAVGSVDVTERP